MKSYSLFLFLSFAYCLPSFTQEAESSLSGKTEIEMNIESLGTFSAGDNASFWLTNNRYGLGSTQNNNGYIRSQMFAKRQLTDQLKLDVAADMVLAHNLNSAFRFQQLYADLSYKGMILSAGTKERAPLFKNEWLSSGGLTLSNNARPIPQVELALPYFTPVPYTQGLLEVMGGVAYGRFVDDGFKRNNSADGYIAEQVLYHRKYGFAKFENNDVWNFILGLEMDTQWGGHFYKQGEMWWKSPARLGDFFRVLLPLSGGSDSNMTDQVNTLGNVYGSVHFITNYRKENYTVKGYIERFFEDHSGLFFKNAPDGLYGVEVNFKKKQWITGIVLEYLHTKDQSGPFLWDKSNQIPVQVSGGDNYYNHFDYISLSNYGFVMGNPLLTSPIYNNGKSLTVFNTRLSSFHGGISGYMNDLLQYRMLVTYSQSWGTPLIPSRNIRNQFSTMIETTYCNKKLQGWLLTGAFSFDKSDMIGNNVGVQFKVSRSFRIQ